MGLAVALPAVRLGRFDLAQQVRQKKRVLAIVIGGIFFGVQPAVRGEVFADLTFEMMSLMKIDPRRRCS